MPAFTHAMAIPPPMVPAPMIATLFTGYGTTSLRRPTTLLTPRSAKNTWIMALGLRRREAGLGDFAFALAAFFKR